MATIGSYTAATTIDASNDYLLIQQSGVYKKINRNTILALASAPLGLTDVQSPTNKIFDNTNQVTLKGTKFTLQDDTSATKQAQFLMSSITAGQTRSYTLPDASTTLVGTGTTQTLTAKTLTSPAITGGTIDNSTVTVDAISGHTVATTVTVANLQIANGVLNTANAVTSTSIAVGAVQPQALVTGTGSGWSWQSWTPTWSNLTVGNGTVGRNKYIQMGKTVFFQYNLTFGTTSSTAGGPNFTLPVTALTLTSNDILGRLTYFDSSSGNIYEGTIGWNSTTSGYLLANRADTTYVTNDGFSATIPIAYGQSDRLALWGFYEAA